jgi:hypothetical protein
MNTDSNVTRKDRREERSFDRKASRRARAAAESAGRRGTTRTQRADLYRSEA